MNLFTIDGLSLNKEDFLENINEYEDIIAIIEELQENLKYDEIECVGENECCNKTKKNYIVEIQGFINQNDEFITMEEAKENNQLNSGVMDLFVIRLYKCVDCGKWIDVYKRQVITLQTLTSLKCLASKGVKVKFAMNPNIPTTAKNPPINVGGRLSTSSI